MPDIDTAHLVDVLRVARGLVDARGYQPEWGKDGGPLNISNALTLACKDYETYVLARQSFSKTWGGPEPGLLHWETYKRRSKSEALDLFDRVIQRLENGEAHPHAPIGGSGRPRAV